MVLKVNFGYQSIFLKISLEKRGHLIIRVILYSINTVISVSCGTINRGHSQGQFLQGIKMTTKVLLYYRGNIAYYY